MTHELRNEVILRILVLLGNLKEILEMLGNNKQKLIRSPKRQTVTAAQNYEKSCIKHSIEKPIFNFVALSAIP